MKLLIDYSRQIGRIKPMNAVNNGPVGGYKGEQDLGNVKDYTAANIPFARTHDASFFNGYGGEHTVDVHAIFPNFDADPELPESYDFFYTDEYLKAILHAGTQVFYRLGTKIEHGAKKYGAHPPKDFAKWAVIAEHIIRHYNEGWADGYNMNITYWEIWNEPDGISGAGDRPNWTGTNEEYFDFYAVVSKHLRKCFSDIKIGGPALSWYNEDFLRPFFTKIRDEKLPFDFYTWHAYCGSPEGILNCIHQHKKILEEYGFGDVECINDEWNYVKSFSGEGWYQTLVTEKNIKGAALIASVMSVCQNEPVDMMMYYDARPCNMNGLFAQGTYDKLKGYYPIAKWGEMLKMGIQCFSSCDISNIYITASSDENGENRVSMITYYTDNDKAYPKTFTVELIGISDCEHDVYLLDETHDMEKVSVVCPNNGAFTLTIYPNTVVVIR